MDLLYTDNRIVVCLKPAGVLSTDEPGGMPELLRRELGEGETGCVRVVHRLDRPVGGVMVYARSRMADSILSQQVQAHTFEKEYLAVLEGIPDAPEGILADLLARDEIAAAAYRYGEAAVEGLAVAAAREGWSRDRLGEAARELGRTVVPPFPVTGHDLADLGIAPGPALGQELARLEDTWINSRFALSKIELLSLVTR